MACLRAALGEVPGLEAALKAALSARGMAAVGATKSMESMLYTLRAHAYRIHGQVGGARGTAADTSGGHGSGPRATADALAVPAHPRPIPAPHQPPAAMERA